MMSLSKPFTISSIGSFKESGDRTSSPSVNSSFCKEIIAFKNSNEEKLFSSYKFFIKNNFCDNLISKEVYLIFYKFTDILIGRQEF